MTTGITAHTGSGASIVIPVKGLASGKSRLEAALSQDQREALNRRLADHTLETAKEAARKLSTDVTVYVLSPDPAFAPIAASHDALFLSQASSGLNSGLEEAVPHLPDHRTVFLAVDLPELTTEDIDQLLDVSGIGIAPDEAQTGTNAISVPQPGILTFHFGPQSAQLHIQSAEKTGLPVQVLRRPGLAFDLDTKEDLSRIQGWQ